MLMVVMMIALVTSHLALRRAIAVIAGDAMNAEALAIVLAYVALVLLLTRASVFLLTPWRRTIIALAYGGVLGPFFTMAAVVGAGSALPSPEWSAALVMALFLVWWAFTHAVIAAVFGANARDDYWSYIKTTYSTFRKS